MKKAEIFFIFFMEKIESPCRFNRDAQDIDVFILCVPVELLSGALRVRTRYARHLYRIFKYPRQDQIDKAPKTQAVLELRCGITATKRSYRGDRREHRELLNFHSLPISSLVRRHLCLEILLALTVSEVAIFTTKVLRAQKILKQINLHSDRFAGFPILGFPDSIGLIPASSLDS
jgi:hypothetical protein